MPRKLDLVAADDIAKRLREINHEDTPKTATVSQWIWRGWPTPRGQSKVKPPVTLGTVAGRVAVFDWPDVERWCKATGRIK